MTFYNLDKTEAMDPLFAILEQTRGVQQKPRHHPEGDVFIHSLQTYGWAIKESDDIDLVLAALLHDVGKAVSILDHDQLAGTMLEGKVSDKTMWLVVNHLRYWSFATGRTRRLHKVTDLVNNPWFVDLAMLGRWDKMGREPEKIVVYDRDAIIEQLRRCCAAL